jgi:hypothetical protein
MSEESNSPEKSTPPEEPTEFAEAEWSDDSAYDSLEQPPEESDTTTSQSEADHDDGIEDEGLDASAVDSTDEMTAALTAAEMVEEEWSDDSAYDSLETAMPSADASDNAATTDTAPLKNGMRRHLSGMRNWQSPRRRRLLHPPPKTP